MKRIAIFVTAVAMVATPLAEVGSTLRVTLANVVVCGLFLISFLSARAGWGNRAYRAAGLVVACGLAVEIVGSRSGFPFGSYDYTDLLDPHVAGVPVAVALAWFAMALPAREVARSITGASSPAIVRIGVGAVALTAWDVFLDPHMVMEGYWVWPNGGDYFGIPLTNYLGWLLVSAVMMVIFELVLPPKAPQRTPVVQYVAVAAMETMGFLFFFGEPWVALWGAATMGSLGLVALGRLNRVR